MKIAKMAKYILIICMLAAGSAYGQNIKASLLLGFNASQVDGDTYAGYHKVGLNTGVSALVPISKRFSWNIELLYNQKGSRKFANPKDGDNVSYKLVLDYADVPLLFNYHDKDKISFGLGVSMGALVRFKEFQDEIETLSTTDDYKKFDYNLLFNGQYNFSPHFGINIRYAISFLNISNIGKQKINKMVTFRLVYVLNPEKSSFK